MKPKVGDIVARKSYQCDLLFRIVALHNDFVELIGEDMRLAADAPYHDLVLIQESERKRRKKEFLQAEEQCYKLFRQDYSLMKQRDEYEASSGYTNDAAFFEMRGRVLHMDGDPLYLRKCTEVYDRLGVPVYGVHVSEKEMPEQIASLIEMVQPDIIVVTGHDAYLKNRGTEKDLKAYRHTKFFAECVRIARRYVPQRDELVIFAGACQSHFETLIKAGANFASSPNRVNIHALDPVYIASRISITSFMERVSLSEVLRNTITGEKGLGGIETKGVMRKGMPLKALEEQEDS
ncbi:sporulation peptidase YabG [Halalkalibacterium halodurans]|uniref:sporulation peptidase YabG n=1 Tax=Halalkalibacterium halodurans TaxID=86665 RepID=UPI00106863E8|nr:sporulation peptidase YabG [Halalkalibacterium halodurans]TES55493.1 sporulation peptidase YabG [Halalkalibacterium halodurans]